MNIRLAETALKPLAILMEFVLLVALALFPQPYLAAAEITPKPEDQIMSSSVEDLSVEHHLHVMDTNHDGMVSVSEVRAYLEARHGKHYEERLLDELEAKAVGRSCASPFTRSFY